ncbi:hypothetical protein NM208_g12656 [Fusarium decemcellulare]|uniref:Uncharacterized protein n=1 Tax=Fusarium decemcellulare TaxID=57161 RepID=A0ACC1RQD3_9HYPO|nr:hypothetical protein NM208_g12656 [Fusarium decemcellulare]
MDALEAKHQVLRMLPSALQSIDSIGGDIVLAAILFLINVELIESGKHNWKAHFDGAGRIMKLLGPVSDVDESLRDYIVSDCFIYYILESTFRPTASDSHSYFQSCQALEILGKTTNSYYCCPPELLEIMLIASRLSNTKQDDVVSADMVTAAGAALLDRAQNFDVLPWARQVDNIPPTEEDPVLSRFRVGTSHRLATCLYILHAIPTVQIWVGEQLADTIFDELHQTLCTIPDDDTNLKATTWVTFCLWRMCQNARDEGMGHHPDQEIDAGVSLGIPLCGEGCASDAVESPSRGLPNDKLGADAEGSAHGFLDCLMIGLGACS